MNGLTLAMVGATALFDVVGQTLFKLGLGHTGDDMTDRPAVFWGTVLREPRILAGIGVYAVEFLVWFAVLSRVDLSIALPLASSSYCGVLVASRFVLGEAVPLQRWLGAALVMSGVAVILFASPV